jgi:hypothetical protein
MIFARLILSLFGLLLGTINLCAQSFTGKWITSNESGVNNESSEMKKNSDLNGSTLSYLSSELILNRDFSEY